MRRLQSTSRCALGARLRAYTLIEMLIIVTILGISASLLIPSMSSFNVLRIQTAVRSLVADVTFMQSDALAAQSRRVLLFGRVAKLDPTTNTWSTSVGNGYTLYAPPFGAASVDLQNDILFDPYHPDQPMSRNFDDPQFGGAVIVNPNFNGDSMLVYDELGGPVISLTGNAPGLAGTVTVQGPDARFDVVVEAFTGRIVVTKAP